MVGSSQPVAAPQAKPDPGAIVPEPSRKTDG
jgi:hypothetical protein